MKIKYFILIKLILLTSCNTMSEAGKFLRNEKNNSTDEFLIEKKDPLVLPPDHKEIPVPDTVKKKSKASEIEEILKIDEEKKTSNKNNSNIEKSILEKIKRD